MPISTTSNSRNDEFAGKVAFITGAGSGIGRATALAFAARGAAVAIADVSAEASRDVADEIVRTGGQALGLTCDVTVSSDVQTALRQTIEAFGRLDFAFNNAGIEQPPTPTRRHHRGSMAAGSRHRPARGVPLHEVRDPADPGRRGRRDHQHLLGGGGQGLSAVEPTAPPSTG